MTEYANIFTEHLTKLKTLLSEQQRINSEIKSVKEMMKASFNMMPDDERQKFSAIVKQAVNTLVTQERGLTEAIRVLLESNRRRWFSAVNVRDKLIESGFDFSTYTSNPLASVHTVLKRLKREEVKTRELLPGNKEYRWIKPSSVPRFEYAPAPTRGEMPLSVTPKNGEK